MTTDIWSLEKNLCRCCHSQGDFKNLAETCIDSDQEEIYVDMIKDSFFIDILPVPGALCAATYSICDDCVSSLRNASNFRKRVEECEEKFQELWSKNAIKLEVPVIDLTVKEEKIESGPEGDDISLGGRDSDELSDFKFDDEDVKSDLEEPIQKKPKKAPAKTTKAKAKSKKPSKSKKVNKDSAEEEKEEKEDGKEAEGSEEGKKKVIRRKFHLGIADYTFDGTTFSCKRCEKKYTKKASILRHVTSVHLKIPRFRCPYCEKILMTATLRTVHKLEEHNIDDRVMCNACNKQFYSKDHLKNHMDMVHKLGQKYSCEFCEFETFGLERIRRHKLMHKKTKDLHCRFCQKAFVRRSNLLVHEKIHTGDKNKVCKECGKAFVQKASLNYHMTKYHPEVHF